MTTGKGFYPINTFEGVFDGNNEKINNLFINSRTYGGLITCFYSGIIKRLGVKVDISSELISAGIVSYVDRSGKVERCFSEGKIISGQESGGIVGEIYRGSIIDSYNLSNVESLGTEPTANWIMPDAGGIVGGCRNVNVINCYNLGNITAKKEASGIAYISSYGVKVINCFNKGNVESYESNARRDFFKIRMGSTNI